MEQPIPYLAASRLHAKRHRQGLTLIEVLISLAVLVITGVGGVSAFMLLNRFASDNRDQSAAQAICQERIEQIMSLPFRPKDGIVPTVSATNPDGTSNTFYLLGQTSDYDSKGTYTGAANKATTTPAAYPSGEPVAIYLRPNDASTATQTVNGFRTVTLNGVGGGYGLVQATVTVTWTIRGQTKSYSLSTLRSVDN